MKRFSRVAALVVTVALVLSAGVAAAKTLSISASPNPARVGDRVRHEVVTAVVARLDVWVSATGFDRPSLGRLPNGTWSFECCPPQTAGTAAWHYRSSSFVPPGQYRFPSIARARGTFLSTVVSAGATSHVWVAIR
jgi:hypothetical protein